MEIALYKCLHCKNKWVEVTHAWLPELQLSFDVCNSGNHTWVISTHLFLQCADLANLTVNMILSYLLCLVTLNFMLTYMLYPTLIIYNDVHLYLCPLVSLS